MSPLSTNVNPYPGIRSFEAAENHLFFGREAQITECIAKLGEHRFLAVIGSSGCGKSSLIKAGIIPALRREPGGASGGGWEVVVLRPGNLPLTNLATALDEYDLQRAGGRSFESLTAIQQCLRGGDHGLISVCQKWHNRAALNLVVFIDQFEELFRFRHDRHDEGRYHEAVILVKLLLAALGQPQVPIYIALSMRSDFIDACTEFVGLAQALNAGSYLVPRMSVEQKVAAICGPAQACGATISAQLQQRLVEDIGDEPDQLPVLQHSLMRTWDYWRRVAQADEAIDIRHYEAIGTVANALSLHGEEIFAGLASQRQRQITEKLFKALTDNVQDGKRTRRPTPVSEICAIADVAEADVVEVIEHFRRPGVAFLMPAPAIALQDATIIDIAHESIMRVWHRLSTWVEDETASADLYLRLSRAAELYQKGETGLWVDPALQVGLNWLNQNRPNSAWAQRYDEAFDRAMVFLEHSKKEHLRALQNRENLQRRRLAIAWRIAIFLGGVSIVSAVSLVVALNLKFQADASRNQALENEQAALQASHDAQQQRREALIQQKIAQQQQQIADQQRLITEEQKQYALTQQQIADRQRQEAFHQKQVAEQARNEAFLAKDDAEQQRQTAVTQKQIAEQQRGLAEESEKNARRLRLIAVARSLAVQAQKILPTNRVLATSLGILAYAFNRDNDGPHDDPDIFYALNAIVDKNQVLVGHTDAVRGVALSSNGSVIYSCSDDGSVRAWPGHMPNVKPAILTTAPAGIGELRCCSVDPAATWLVAGSRSGAVVAWNLTKKQNVSKLITQAPATVSALCATADAGVFALGCADGTVQVWDVASGQMAASVRLSNRVNAIAWNRADGTLVCGLESGVLQLLAVRQPRNDAPQLKVSDAPVSAVALSGDGKVCAVGTNRGTVTLWQVGPQWRKYADLIGHLSTVGTIAFHPSRPLLATGSYDRSVRLWNYERPTDPAIVLKGHDGWVYAIAVTSDGERIVAGCADKTLHTWCIAPKVYLEEACAKWSRNLSVDEWNTYIGPDITYAKTCVPQP